MPALIFRFNKESKSFKETLIKDPALSIEQSLKSYETCSCFSSLISTTN